MQARRAIFATALSFSLITIPAWGAPTAALGTVIAADRAHVGEAKAEVGTTVYGGDSISTELQGSVQLRAGKARLLLLSSSSAVVSDTQGAPAAKLLSGAATFSTGNAHAFTLFASAAAIRPQTDAPTIGRVSYIGPKELLVRDSRVSGCYRGHRYTDHPGGKLLPRAGGSTRRDGPGTCRCRFG